MMRHTTRATEAPETAAGEHTEVRARTSPEHVPAPRDVFERGRDALALLAPDDPNVRLLQVALLRRDEVLLDAVLRRLDAPPPK